MINIMYFFKSLECGHFCLKHILKTHKLKNKSKYCKRMMSLGQIRSILLEYFYEVNCYFINDFNSIDKNREFLTLLRVKKDCLHYIVVKKVKNDYVYYYDPAYWRKRRKKIKDFLKFWSHYCCFYDKKSNC